MTRRPRIDLHLHTTASDGRCAPAELVTRAAAAGVTVMALTDHDTMAGIDGARAAAIPRGIEVIAGIEITAVDAGRDVHVLGYFLDPAHQALATFLASQRETRIRRVEAIAARLAALGAPVDVVPLMAQARESHGSIGRPHVAAAMIAAGHVRSTREAFDRYLAADGPAYVPRTGALPEQVIAIVHAAGGLVSLAHPGRTKIDARIGDLRDAGLDALEVFHPDHDEALVARYGDTARALGLLVTGGSDFHGIPGGSLAPGSAGPPEAEWRRMVAARDRHARP